MSEQSEALRLAELLAEYLGADHPAVRAISAELRRLEEENGRLFIEREHAQIMYERAIELMTGIYSLLYPAPTALPDGRVMMFRPKSPDPHEVLQELSDRIRALPDEMASAAVERKVRFEE